MNCFSVDVEEYFQCEAFAGRVSVDSWSSRASRVEVGLDALLPLLDEHGIRATFFVLGWVAERRPRLVRALSEAGHEVASHGYGHQHLSRLTPEAFREDVVRSLGILQDCTGRPVLGYRAPTFSIIRSTAWAADVLIGLGLRYDSSIYPIHHDRYGVPEAPVAPFWLTSGQGRILELPPLAASWWKLNVPVGGGGYLRLLPVRLIDSAVARANREGRPAMIYVHPWELDPGQPRLPCSRLTRFRHYTNLHRTRAKLDRLFSRHPFGRAAEMAGALARDASLATWSFEPGAREA
jgi:polysaccharide deacetylase family protein (PEP-CTERM system associated)